MTPTPQITLTEHQQWAVTISQELEAMGWVGAANALRRKHFPHLPWGSVDKAHGASTYQGWVNLFRVHHGSLPPIHAAHPAQPITPAPRPDQPIG